MSYSDPYQTPNSNVDDDVVNIVNQAKLEQVVNGQKMVIFAILLYVASTLLPVMITFTSVAAFTLIFSLVAFFLSTFGIYQITTGLHYHSFIKVFLLILMLVPFANLLTMLFASNRATKALRIEGYKVGFWGAKAK